MNLTDELRKLAALHEAGHLNDQEFADAKQRVITAGHSDSAPASRPPEKPAASDAATLIEEKTYQSSRWSSGNLFFPDRLTLASDGMLFRKGAMFGSNEEHINYRAIASFRIKNGIFLSNLSIETSGGSQPIFVNGLWRSAANEIQETLRTVQGKS